MRDVTGDGLPPVPITADNVSVRNLTFYLDGHETGDKKNPKITIVLGVGATGLSESLISIQTTINSRVLQID